MANVKGICDERFAKVRETLKKSLDSGADIGASAAVFIDGKPVVDIWGGFFDADRKGIWERDTIVNTFSTTKTMTALCMLILADRGQINLDSPVKKYWPEFGSGGREEILVRHFLGHTSGMPGWTEPVTIPDILDREKATALLARQTPWWKPGTVAGYHSITFGLLNGEIVRRVTGQTLTKFFATEVAEPLKADYHIGATPDCDSRVSRMIRSSLNLPRSDDPNSFRDRVFFNPFVTPEDSGTIPWRRAELGGSNGHGNARSVATIQNLIACGGQVGGVRLLSEAGCRRIFELQFEGTDVVGLYPLQWGMGYAIGGAMVQSLYGGRFEGRRVAMWAGSGGSMVVNDFDARMTIAFVMNRYVEKGGTDERSVNIINAAFDSYAAGK